MGAFDRDDYYGGFVLMGIRKRQLWGRPLRSESAITGQSYIFYYKLL